MHRLWLSVISRCGYRYRQFLLSPDTLLGIPNTRKRYYCIAVFNENHNNNSQQTIAGIISQSIALSSFPGVEEEDEEQDEEKRTRKRKDGEENQSQKKKNDDDVNKDTNDNDEEDHEEEADESEEPPGDNEDHLDDENPLHEQNESSSTDPTTTVFTSLPLPLPHLSSEAITEPKTIEETLLRRISSQEWQQYNNNNNNSSTNPLLVPRSILQSSWAKKHLSIVSLDSRLSYCFTKGYGKIFDHSAGSCLFIPSPTSSFSSSISSSSGLMDDNEERELYRKEFQEIDRENLPSYYGRIRLFHPNELLAIFGYPNEFRFPPLRENQESDNSSNNGDPRLSPELLRQFGCIGNSINISVVKAVMNYLFEEF
jgi:site-specific DNA-cytosine methylase